MKVRKDWLPDFAPIVGTLTFLRSYLLLSVVLKKEGIRITLLHAYSPIVVHIIYCILELKSIRKLGKVR